jgi:hypothetical protein
LARLSATAASSQADRPSSKQSAFVAASKANDRRRRQMANRLDRHQQSGRQARRPGLQAVAGQPASNLSNDLEHESQEQYLIGQCHMFFWGPPGRFTMHITPKELSFNGSGSVAILAQATASHY